MADVDGHHTSFKVHPDVSRNLPDVLDTRIYTGHLCWATLNSTQSRPHSPRIPIQTDLSCWYTSHHLNNNKRRGATIKRRQNQQEDISIMKPLAAQKPTLKKGTWQTVNSIFVQMKIRRQHFLFS